MARLVVAPEAQSDLDAILDYLTREAGRGVALRFAQRFRHTFDLITDNPGTGAPRPNFGPVMRIKTVWPYVIFYRYAPEDDTVRVLRVIHGRRNIKAALFAPK